MIDDETDRDGKTVLRSLFENFAGDVTLSEAMKGSGFFPDYMVNMIHVGEKTGRLTETLKALAEHYMRQERLAVAIKNAVFYPAIMLAMMTAVVLILIVQVLPIFNEVFERMGAQMSPFALGLMEFGAWFSGASVFVAFVFLAGLTLAFLAWMVPSVRSAISRGFSGRGVFGRVADSRFVSSMALALASGINLEESVELATALGGGSVKYEKCAELLRGGKNLSEALRGVLSARDVRILSLGDKSGAADFAMAEIARRKDIALQDEISNIVGKVEPTLVIFTSVIVGVILLSVMLPLMGIMTTI
jgi:type IV pilus assembly protein PilC